MRSNQCSELGFLVYDSLSHVEAFLLFRGAGLTSPIFSNGRQEFRNFFTNQAGFSKGFMHYRSTEAKSASANVIMLQIFEYVLNCKYDYKRSAALKVFTICM